MLHTLEINPSANLYLLISSQAIQDGASVKFEIGPRWRHEVHDVRVFLLWVGISNIRTIYCIDRREVGRMSVLRREELAFGHFPALSIPVGGVAVLRIRVVAVIVFVVLVPGILLILLYLVL